VASKKSSVISVLITGDSKQLSGAVDEANGRLGKLGSSIGLAAKAVAAGAAAIGAVAVREFAKFDGAMQKSVAIMGDVSDALRDDMAKAAREVAKTTTFSAEQAAESYFFLASAGLDASASIAAMPKVAAFAQAGMFDMARATDLLTDAQSALGMVIRDDAVANMEQMVRLSDVLVKANTLANASVEQFSTALTTKAGAALRALNKDMEEGVAVLAAFADQGIKGEIAGTQLSIVLRDLTTRAIRNKDEFRNFGLEVFDSQGKMRNMADIVGDLESGLDGMSDEVQKATLLQLGFSDKSLGALMALMGTSEQIRIYEQALRDAGGVTDEIAEKQLQTFSAQMSLLKSLFQDVAIEIGGALVPALSKIVSFIQSKGPQIAVFAEIAGEKIAAFIETVGEKAREFKTFFDERLREPVEAVGKAIATFVSEARTRLSEFAGAVPGAVKAFTDFIAEVRQLADDPRALGERLGQALAGALMRALEEIKSLSAQLNTAFRELIARVDWFSIGRSALTALIQFGLGFAAAFLTFEWLGPVLTAIRENLGVILLAALGLALAPAKLTTALAGILAKIPFAGRLISWAVLALQRMGTAIKNAIGIVLGAFGQAFSVALGRIGPGIISRFSTFLRGLPQALRTTADEVVLNVAIMFGRFGGAVGNAVSRLVVTFRSLMSTLFAPFRNFGNMLKDDLFLLGKNLIDALVKGIGSMGGVLAKAVRNIGKSVFDTLSKLWKIKSPSKVFLGIGEDAMAGLALGLSGSERMLRELTTGIGTSALPSIDLAGPRSGAAPIVINVTGAIDPEGTARTILRTLRDAERRTGERLVV
jgi:TP901 family phage tail tape measure protein